MEEVKEEEDIKARPEDLVAVLEHIEAHPVHPEQSTLMVSAFGELLRLQSFRQWFSASVPPEQAAAVVHNVALLAARGHCGQRDAFVAFKIMCSLGRILQTAVFEETLDLVLHAMQKDASDSLLFQVLSNCITQHPENAAALLKRTELFGLCEKFAKAASKNKTAVMALLYNLYCSLVDHKGKAEVARRVAELSPLLREQDPVWTSNVIRCLLEHEGDAVSLAEVCDQFGTEAVFECFLHFHHLLVRFPQFCAENAFGSETRVSHLANATADESESVRVACVLMCKEHGLLERILNVLRDPSSSPALVLSSLQLVGNCVYRNEVWIAERLLELGGVADVLKLTAFNPDTPFTREWSMVCIRNCTEVSAKVHEFLQGLKVVGLDEHAASNKDLEERLGRKISLNENGQLILEKKK